MIFSTHAITQSTTLYSNDFESSTTGYITATNPSDPVWKYQWNAHSSCASTDIWRIGSSGGYGTNSSITGNYASIDYGSSSCVQDISFATQEFTATKSTIDIEFDCLIFKLRPSINHQLHDRNFSMWYLEYVKEST